MLLSHAVVLAEARSYIVALADSTSAPAGDRAGGLDASLDYERVLLQLDWLHGGTVPPITVVPIGDREVLVNVARAAIANLAEHGIDRLEVAIALSMLEAAWNLDQPPS